MRGAELGAHVNRQVSILPQVPRVGVRDELLGELLAEGVIGRMDALRRAADTVARMFAVDKVDLWFPEGDWLRAAGVSTTAMGRQQVALGLDHFRRGQHGEIWNVLDTGTPYVTGRADVEDGIEHDLAERLGIRSLLAVPLEVAKARRGVLLLADATPDRFRQRDIQRVASVAHWAGLALAQIDLIEESSRRVAAEARADQWRRLHALTDIAIAVLPLDELLAALLERVSELFTADTVTILLLDPERQILRVHASRGLQQEVRQQVEVPVGRGIAGKVAATGEAMVVPDVPAANPVSPILREHVRSMVAVPLVHEHTVVGVLHAGTRRPHTFDAADVDLLRLAADRVALGIERAQVLERERTLAAENARLYVVERSAREKAEAAIRARDQFLSIVSHELRNPLSGMRGSLQLLARHLSVETLDRERLQRYSTMLQGSVGRLERLVDDLLDVTRATRGGISLRLAQVDMAAVVDDEIERAVSGAAEVETPPHMTRSTSGDTPPPIMADSDRVRQVLANLLSNAIKYSPGGGPIRVSVEREGDGVAVTVVDSGIGLPAGMADAIFEPFVRGANAADSTLPGMGLGLFISRQIVEAHGGYLSASSPGEGLGTTMKLWLPLHPTLAAPVSGQ